MPGCQVVPGNQQIGFRASDCGSDGFQGGQAAKQKFACENGGLGDWTARGTNRLHRTTCVRESYGQTSGRKPTRCGNDQNRWFQRAQNLSSRSEGVRTNACCVSLTYPTKHRNAICMANLAWFFMRASSVRFFLRTRRSCLIIFLSVVRYPQ